MPTDALPRVTSAVDHERARPAFHVGYEQFHPDVSLNFQLNRWVQWLGDDAVLADMQAVAPRIKDYADWKREFLHLADVLLLAGSEDHYVPRRQFYQQAGALKRARSLTGRIFTRHEHAQNHCQIGNLGLALQVILHWLDGLDQRTTRPGHAGKEHSDEAQPT